MSDTVTTYASVSDLESRYRKLSDNEKAIAEVLLKDVAVMLRLEYKRYNIKLEPDGDLLWGLKQVSCSVVKRVLASPGFEDMFGGVDIREFRTDVGQLAETYGFANPDGTLNLKASERRMLGLTNKGRISTVPYHINKGYC